MVSLVVRESCVIVYPSSRSGRGWVVSARTIVARWGSPLADGCASVAGLPDPQGEAMLALTPASLARSRKQAASASLADLIMP